MVESLSLRWLASPSRHVSAVQSGCAHTKSMTNCSSGLGVLRLRMLNIVALKLIAFLPGGVKRPGFRGCLTVFGDYRRPVP